MSTMSERLTLSAFACVFGDRERTPETIADHAAICAARGLGLGLGALGGKTFWQMTAPVETYVARCVAATLVASGVAATDVQHVVFATMDKNLRHLDQDFARKVLGDVGLINSMPALVSMQQCASSLGAVDHARRLFTDPGVEHALVVALDFVVDDAERIQPFALFGDAVTSCLLSRGAAGGLAVLAYGANMDFSGLVGRDNFETRKKLVVATLARVLEQGGTRLDQVERCFTTNFFKPVALFNAGVCGVQRKQLCIDTLPTRAHCGNCDWMVNLVHHREQVGLVPGAKYLAQAFAPGFFGCVLLEAAA